MRILPQIGWLLAGFATSATAWQGTTIAPEGISVPVDPPLGTPLRYRLVREIMRGGRSSRTTNDMAITFGRNAGDLTLRVDYVLPPAVAPGTPSAVLMQPVTFRLDGRGRVIGIVDEPAYWATINRALDRIERMPTRTAEDSALVADVRDLQRQPEADRAKLLAVRVERIVDYAGLTVRAEATMDMTLGGQAYQRRSRAEALGGGTARISVETVDQGVQAAGTAASSPAAAAAASGRRWQEREVHIVSLRTGLTERYESRRVADDSDASRRVETVSALIRIP